MGVDIRVHPTHIGVTPQPELDMVNGTTKDGRKIWVFFDTNIPHGAHRVQLETRPGSNLYEPNGRLAHTDGELEAVLRELRA